MNQTHLGGIDVEINNNLVPKIFHATKLNLVFWHNHLPLVFSRLEDHMFMVVETRDLVFYKGPITWTIKENYLKCKQLCAI
jgi:hypothetical protein